MFLQQFNSLLILTTSNFVIYFLENLESGPRTSITTTTIVKGGMTSEKGEPTSTSQSQSQPMAID